MKRWMSYFLAVYVLLCLGFSAYGYFQEKETVKTESYGIATDDTIVLTEDRPVSVEFCLTEEQLEGISVRFQSDYGFGQEIMSARLYDVEAGELLAEDTVELKYEMVRNKDYGSTLYFSLPISQPVGKNVRVDFRLEGEKIYVHPELVVSNSKIQDSDLYVNGQRENQNLVFSARYHMGTEHTITAIFKGLLAIFAGGALFWLLDQDRFADFRLVERKQEDDNRCRRSRSWKSYVGLGALCLFLFVLFVYVYQYAIEKRIEKQKEVVIYEKSDQESYLTLSDDILKVEQSFLCARDRLDGILLSVLPVLLEEDTKISVTVKDETTGEFLADTFLDLHDARNSEGETDYRIRLDRTLVKSKDHLIRVCLECENIGSSCVGLALSGEKNAEQSEKMQLMVNGENRNELLAVSIECENSVFLNRMYVILCVLLIIFAVILFQSCFIGAMSLERAFFPLAIVMGVIVSLVIGVYTVPDEPSHIDSAYQLSNELLGIPDSPLPDHIYKRADDIDPTVEEKQSLDVTSYERLYDQLFTRVQDETLIECAVSNNYANAGRIYYLPQAVGVSIGRLLKLGTMPTLMLGRFFSLLCYVMMTCLAIKKMPFAKTSLFLIGMLPISLQQAASFSYDAVLNAVSFLFVSCCLAFVYNNGEIKRRDIVTITVLGSMMSTVKGGVYLPLVFLPVLVLIRRKRVTGRNVLSILLVVSIPVLAFVVNNFSSTFGRLSAAQGSVVGGAHNQEVYTFGYLMKYPQRVVGMFVNTFYKQGDSYIRNLLGGNLAWREVNITWGIVFGFLLIILLSSMEHKKEITVSGREKLWLGVVSAGSFGLIELSMLLAWTPVTLTYITGVQGRYFIPFFILVLIVLRNSFFCVKRDISRELIFAGGMFNIITVLQVLQFVLG